MGHNSKKSGKKKSQKEGSARQEAEEDIDTNLFSVLSMIKLQTVSGGGKAKGWRRRTNSTNRMSLISNNSLETKTLPDIEEEFLHAAEFGDIPTVKQLLAENENLNVDCIDALGRTALRLAVKNEHLEVVEVLLEKSSRRHVFEAVLQAISAGHVQIAESILKHRRYLEIWKDRKKFGDDDHFFKTQFEESQFSPDITPLILSAQKNQYEIVQLLLLRGERIQKPHKFGCMCQECVNKMKFDQLRSAKYRLNAYRGMASDAYISLSSKDPILTAFELSHELKSLSTAEKYFKQEYKELSNQLSEYVVKLLDRVRTQDELELVLNKTGKPTDEKYSTLARLSLAIEYNEKKFVSHPSCQQRLDKSWLEGIGPFRKAGIFKRLFMLISFIVAYPFLNIIYIIVPNNNLKVVKILRFPWVKFAMHSASFIAFLVMIIFHTTDATYSKDQNYTLATLYPAVFEKYVEMMNISSDWALGADLPVRPMLPSVTQMLISIWVLGFLYHECVQIYQGGVHRYVKSLYNLMDYALIVVYTASFTLQYGVMLRVHLAMNYLKSTDVTEIIYNSAKTEYHLYWVVADRFYWETWDPVNLAEGLFAVANILSFSRISYLLPANEALGPLQISVGRMVKDILKCLCLIVMVAIAFVIGLQNVYWYYNVRESIEVEDRDFEVPAQQAFGNSIKTFRTVFWSVFGRGEINVVTLNKYDNHLTEDFGYLLYGVYNVIMVTVLINMLIAMMARSFQAIAEESDVEWKFARSILYMEYMDDGEVLPVPLNLGRFPRAVCEWVCNCGDDSLNEPEVPRSFAQLDAYENQNERPPVNGRTEPSPNAVRIANKFVKGPSGDGSMDMDEFNEFNRGGTRRKHHQQRNSIPGFLDRSKSYQRVMQRIVQRYIFDIQREAEITEDDFEEVKQDISGFRYEMLNAMESRETQFNDLQKMMSRLTNSILDVEEDDRRASTKRTLSKLRARLMSQDRLSRDSFFSTKNGSEAEDDIEEGDHHEHDEHENDAMNSEDNVDVDDVNLQGADDNQTSPEANDGLAGSGVENGFDTDGPDDRGTPDEGNATDGGADQSTNAVNDVANTNEDEGASLNPPTEPNEGGVDNPAFE